MAGFNATISKEVADIFSSYSGSVRAEIVRAICDNGDNFATVAEFNDNASNYASTKLMFTRCGDMTMMFLRSLNKSFNNVAQRQRILDALYHAFQINKIPVAGQMNTSEALRTIYKLRTSIVRHVNNATPAGYMNFDPTINTWPHECLFFIDLNRNVRSDKYNAMVLPILINKKFDDVRTIIDRLSGMASIKYSDYKITVPIKKIDDILENTYGAGVYNADMFDSKEVLHILRELGARRIYDVEKLSKNVKYDTWRAQAIKRQGTCAVLYPTSINYVSGSQMYTALHIEAHAETGNINAINAVKYCKYIYIAEAYNNNLFFNSNVTNDDGTTITLDKYLSKFISGMNNKAITFDYNNLILEFKTNLNTNLNIRSYAKNDFNIAGTIELADRVIVIYSIAMPVPAGELLSNDFNNYYYGWAKYTKHYSKKISEIQRKLKHVEDKSYSFTSDPDKHLSISTAEKLLQEINKNVKENNVETKVVRTSDVSIQQLVKILTAYMGTNYNGLARATTDANRVVEEIEMLQDKAYVVDNINCADLSIHTVKQDYLVGRNNHNVFNESGININRTSAFSLHRYIQINQYQSIHSEVLFVLVPGSFDRIMPTYKRIEDRSNVINNASLVKYKPLENTSYEFYAHSQEPSDMASTCYENSTNVTGVYTSDLANVIGVKKIFDIDSLFAVYCIVSARLVGMRLEVKD